MEVKAVALIQILIQSQTTKVAATRKRIVDLIRTVRLNIVNKHFLFKKLILNKYVKRQRYISNLLFLLHYCDFCKKISCRALQGALKLKITMKGPKKEDSEKIKCEKSKRTVTKKPKTNHGSKVIIINNF